MKAIRNIAVGFGISFIGSVPLGYLNVVGFELFSKDGYGSLLPFIAGVVCEEAVVIYLTLAFAEKLAKGGRLVKIIEIFSIVFLLVLAAYFFFRNNSETQQQHPVYLAYPPFIAGVVLNAINFMQLPFWTGWNVYLLNNKYIFINSRIKYLYLIGALMGTFAGMLAFILSLHFLAHSIDGLSHYLMTLIIPLIFLCLALFQAYKFYTKYGTTKIPKS